MSTPTLKNAFVLHTRAYRETSIIAELLTLEEGRVGVLAKGAKRRYSTLGAVNQQLTPLTVAYQGRGELQTLTHCEVSSPGCYFSGTKLLSALYLNELLMRLLSRGDAVADIFALYQKTLDRIKQQSPVANTLRLFEKHLLVYLGYGINLQTDAETEKKIVKGKFYRYHPGHGFVVVTLGQASQHTAFSGESIIALQQENLTEAKLLTDAKILLRLALAPLLGSRPIKTRELLQGDFHD